MLRMSSVALGMSGCVVEVRGKRFTCQQFHAAQPQCPNMLWLRYLNHFLFQSFSKAALFRNPHGSTSPRSCPCFTCREHFSASFPVASGLKSVSSTSVRWKFAGRDSYFSGGNFQKEKAEKIRRVSSIEVDETSYQSQWEEVSFTRVIWPPGQQISHPVQFSSPQFYIHYHSSHVALSSNLKSHTGHESGFKNL